MKELSLLAILGILIGLRIGWGAYTAVVAILVRSRKGAPLFRWRDGVFFGIALLAAAVAFAVWSQSPEVGATSRLWALLGAAMLAGAAANQLWLCWRALEARRSR